MTVTLICFVSVFVETARVAPLIHIIHSCSPSPADCSSALQGATSSSSTPGPGSHSSDSNKPSKVPRPASALPNAKPSSKVGGTSRIPRPTSATTRPQSPKLSTTTRGSRRQRSAQETSSTTSKTAPAKSQVEEARRKKPPVSEGAQPPPKTTVCFMSLSSRHLPPCVPFLGSVFLLVEWA